MGRSRIAILPDCALMRFGTCGNCTTTDGYNTVMMPASLAQAFRIAGNTFGVSTDTSQR